MNGQPVNNPFRRTAPANYTYDDLQEEDYDKPNYNNDYDNSESKPS